jgi:hypothetical protein
VTAGSGLYRRMIRMMGRDVTKGRASSVGKSRGIQGNREPVEEAVGGSE